MPWQRKGADYLAGRGFRPGLGFQGSAQRVEQPTEQPAADDTAADDTEEPSGGWKAFWEQRAARVAQVRQSRAAGWERHQRAQERVTGGYGFRRFWEGRPELTGTLPMDYDWKTINRPAIAEGFGPMGGKNRIANALQAHTEDTALAQQEREATAAAAAHGEQGDDNGSPEPSSAPSSPASAPIKDYPPSVAGYMPPGSQFSAHGLYPSITRSWSGRAPTG